MRRRLILSFLITTINILCCTSGAKQKSTINVSLHLNADLSKSVYCIPIGAIRLQHIQDGVLISDTTFRDSFFVEAANGLLAYEISKFFSITQYHNPKEAIECMGSLSKCYCGASTLSSCKPETESILNISKLTGADYIIVPICCSIQQSAISSQGWRKHRSNLPYKAPFSYFATAQFHLQIWNSKGDLLYENIGRATTGRPTRYSLVESVDKTNDKLRPCLKIYVPLLIKALNESIYNALNLVHNKPN